MSILSEQQTCYDCPKSVQNPQMTLQDDDLEDEMLDVDLISSQTLIPSSQAPDEIILTEGNIKVLDFINGVFGGIISSLATAPSRQIHPEIVLKQVKSLEYLPQAINDRGSPENRHGICSVQPRIETRFVTYSWPGKTPEKTRRFACLLAVFLEIKAAIEKGITVTKRDVYYRQPELFQKQDVVDCIIDDIAFTCGVTRRDLRVTASPKGLFCGLSPTDEVFIVPEDPEIVVSTMNSQLQWILVIEKEASFKKLVEHTFHRSSLVGHGLIATGKGYPDLNTRYFLRYVLDSLPYKIPIFGLFDGDPDGLEIFRCYQMSSRKSVQESGCNLPEMKWLGVDVEEFLRQPKVMRETLELTARDRARARSMLGRKELEMAGKRIEADGDLVKTRRMLQIMLLLNLKIEIQAVAKVDGELCGWLAEKMRIS